MADEKATSAEVPSEFKALARLAQRTNNPVVSELYTHVLNAPLLVEPVRGAALLGAYLHGDTETIYGGASGIERVGKVAIINISGALVSRPMPGPSGDGPLSYEEIRSQFDAALQDATVDAIVLRIDSPGGFVSGCFDLTDHIFKSRGKKPLVAAVDDMAFSAAYAIAAACDEIWVSRTGGVGSIGVIAFHVDQSGFDQQLGVKWTAVYAGAHKNDFSPHEPFRDAARERLQTEVFRIYGIYTGAAASYRGLDEEKVRATEALTYYGPDALAAGLADQVGTLEDALAALGERMRTDPQRGFHGAATTTPVGRDPSEQSAAGFAGNQPSRRNAMSTAPNAPAITRETIAEQHPQIAEAFRAEGFAKGREAGRDEGEKHAKNTAAADIARAKDEGRAAGAEAERARIKSLDDLPAAGHEALIAQFKADGKTTSAEAALQILNAEKTARTAALGQRRGEAPAPVRTATAPMGEQRQQPADDKRPLETRAKEVWESDPDLRAEFADSYERYFAYAQAQEDGRVRVFRGKAASGG